MQAEHLWAKSNDAGGYPLPRHLLDVAAVARSLLLRLPERARLRLAETLLLPPDDAAAWATIWAGSHDLGKASPGFQMKWAPGAAAAQAAGFAIDSGLVALGDRHDAFTQTVLAVQSIRVGMPRRLASLVSRAVAAHHGFRIAKPPTRAEVDAFPEPWRRAHHELFELLVRVNGSPGVPERLSSDLGWLSEWLAGFTSLVDWIGSSAAFFPHDRVAAGYEAHWAHALRLADAALDHLGLLEGSPLALDAAPTRWLDAVLDGRIPRPLQRDLATALGERKAPLMVVVEAPMGEGKTELALYMCLHQVGHGQRGVYFALPTQATANGIARRMDAFVEVFARPQVADLQLVHGGAAKVVDSVLPRGIDGGRQDAEASAWFRRSRRGLVAPLGVGTVDQAIVGVLNAKHRALRLFALADRFVVLDEVHAYDTYTSGLIARLLAWLGTMDSSVLLMSATLPDRRRRELLEAWTGGPVDEADERIPYPRATVISRRQGEAPIRMSFSASRRYRVALRPTSSATTDVATRAAALAASGGCIAVVCNTVRRAQAVYVSLRDLGVPTRLFHARFPLERRNALEQEVIEAFGPHGSRPACRVLVATQVVEQSLDVDFDAFVTDLAPVDLVLQRSGRLHRHPRTGRPHPEPVLWIAGLDVRSGELPRGLATVYEPEPVLRTLALLRDLPDLDFPDSIDALVQAAYADSFAWPADLVEAGDRAATQTREHRERDARLAMNAVLPLPADFDAAFLTTPRDDAAAEASTRLGMESVTVVPVYDLGDRWAAEPAGAHWARDAAIPVPVAERLADRAIRVSNPGLIRMLRRQPSPESWDRHGALAHTLPLTLDARGRCIADPRLARLDDELGLVYGPEENLA